MILRAVWHRCRAWVWYAVAALVIFLLARRALRRPDQRVSVGPLFRRALDAQHEADLARRRLEAEHEQRVRAIRRGLAEQLEELELQELDHRARMIEDDKELVTWWEQRARDLEVGPQDGSN